MKLKIGKGDKVQVITGKQKGQQGAVLQIDKQRMKIRIQGVRMQTHFDKQEGRFPKEGFIAYSNVKLVEKSAKFKKKKAPTKSKAK